MNARDFDYIEERLIAPCSAALDAHERLKQHDSELAEELMKYIQEFTDNCRMVRAEFVSTAKRGA